jgi:hypothetical protein
MRATSETSADFQARSGIAMSPNSSAIHWSQLRFRNQLEVQQLCRPVRHFFPARGGLAGDRQQCHPMNL